MALPRVYLTTVKNLPAIFEAMKSAQAPDKFTIKFLESLDFKSAADRLIVNVLKAIGFLSADGSPTERYFRFLDQTQSSLVLGEAVREAYADLFQVNKNANLMTKSDVINKMKTLSQGQFSESVLDKMSMTFLELCKLSDFSKRDAIVYAVKEIPPPAPVVEYREKSQLTNNFGGLFLARMAG
jgi:hypothetical protein